MAKPKQYPGQKAMKKLLPKPAFKQRDRRIKIRLSDAVIISYPKCGRTWLRAMLTLYCAKLYGTPEDLLYDFANLHNLDPRAPKLYFSHEADYMGAPESIHIDPQLRHKKLVFLARDPRDMIVSLYAHRVHRDKNWDGSIEDFINSPAGGFATALRYYHLWSDFLAGHPDALVIRYEDLHADPETAFAAILGHLGQPVDVQAIRETIEETKFARLREKESKSAFQSKRLNAVDLEDPQAFKVRRGVVGGFADDLQPGMVSRIGRMMDQELHGAFGYQVE